MLDGTTSPAKVRGVGSIPTNSLRRIVAQFGRARKNVSSKPCRRTNFLWDECRRKRFPKRNCLTSGSGAYKG